MKIMKKSKNHLRNLEIALRIAQGEKVSIIALKYNKTVCYIRTIARDYNNYAARYAILLHDFTQLSANDKQYFTKVNINNFKGKYAVRLLEKYKDFIVTKVES